MATESERWSAWMREAQAGDEQAYRRLIEELYDATKAYLRSVLYDPERIEDCVQDCLMTLHRARASYDPRRPFNPWYFTIVRHRARDVIRRRAPRNEPFNDEVSAGDGAPFAETRGDVERLLRMLSPAQRGALEMTKLQGLTIEEAATRAGVATGTMKARVHRGLKRLIHIAHAEWTGQ